MTKFTLSIRTHWYVVAAILTAYIYYRVAPLQVDPHHDGVILGAAIAVAEGHPIHSGAFSQYGPLPALLQGFILSLTNTDLLTLRYVTAIQCLAIGFVLYRLAVKFVNEQLAKVTSFFWLLTSCIWVTQFPGALLPWPSLISTLFVLIGVTQLINSAEKSKSSLAILAGALFGFAGFCRVQVFILLPLIVFFSIVKKQKQTRILYFSMIGYLLSITSVISFLILTGEIQDAIEQVFITPLLVYPAVGEANNYNRFQFMLYVIEAVAFLVLFFATRFIMKKSKSKSLNIVAITTSIFGVSLVGIWIAKSSFPIRYRVLFGEPLQNLVISPFYFAAASCLFLASLFFFGELEKRKKIGFPETTIVLVAVGTLLQLYPQPDVMHLWWVSPIFMCSLLVCIKIFFNPEKDSLKTLQTILISCIIFGVITAFQFLERPWAEYKLGVLKGTFAMQEKARSLDIFKKIEEVAVAGDTSFDCLDGVYAVASGTYLAADQWFVNWGFAGTSENQKIGSVRIICDKSRGFAISEGSRLKMELSYYQKNEAGKSIAILEKIG